MTAKKYQFTNAVFLLIINKESGELTGPKLGSSSILQWSHFG